MSFQCKDGCKADCCGIVPIPKRVYKRHRQDIQKDVDTVFDLGNEVLIVSRDGYCAFLDSIGKCIIYKERPLICKLYGIDPKLPCPYGKADGILRNEKEVHIIQNQINDTVNTALARLKR